MEVRLKCSLVRDLLPLYEEKLVQKSTEELVETHLKRCADCREALAEQEEIRKQKNLEEEQKSGAFQRYLLQYRFQALGVVFGFLLIPGLIAAGFFLVSVINSLRGY